MDLNELWIGDYLRIKSSGEQGTYEGKDEQGRALIKIDSSVRTAEVIDIELIEMPKIDLNAKPVIEEVESEDSEHSDDIWANFSSIIDLHIVELVGEDPKDRPADPLSFQVAKCRTFISKAVEKKLKRIIIIHGKGDGTLKTEVHLLLKTFPEVGMTLDIHEGGATEVHLKSGKY